MENGFEYEYKLGLFQNDIQVVETLRNNIPDNVQLKILNGYDSIRKEVDQGNTLTVENPVAM